MMTGLNLIIQHAKVIIMMNKQILRNQVAILDRQRGIMGMLYPDCKEAIYSTRKTLDDVKETGL